jgi:hypothetical protein
MQNENIDRSILALERIANALERIAAQLEPLGSNHSSFFAQLEAIADAVGWFEDNSTKDGELRVSAVTYEQNQ